MPNPIDFTLYLITDRHQVPPDRTPSEVEAMLRQRGYEPVGKDWDSAFHR